MLLMRGCPGRGFCRCRRNLNLSGGAGAGARGGSVYLFGGDGTGAMGGSIYLAGGAGADNAPRRQPLSGGATAQARGGDVYLGDTLPGGDILSMVDDAIDTRTGLLEIGLPEARAASTAAGNTVYLPVEVGTRTLATPAADNGPPSRPWESRRPGWPPARFLRRRCAAASCDETEADVIDGSGLLRPLPRHHEQDHGRCDVNRGETRGGGGLHRSRLTQRRHWRYPGRQRGQFGHRQPQRGGAETAPSAAVSSAAPASGRGRFGHPARRRESGTRGGNFDARGGTAPLGPGRRHVPGRYRGRRQYTAAAGLIGLLEFGLAAARTTLVNAPERPATRWPLPLESGL